MKNKKFLFMLFSFIVLSVFAVFNNNCYATTNSIVFNDGESDVTLSDLPLSLNDYNAIVIKSTNTSYKYYLMFYGKDTNLVLGGTNGLQLTTADSSKITFYFVKNDLSYQSYGSISLQDGCYTSNFYYSSADVLDSSGNVVFQGPTLTTLAEALEKANPVETFQTMMAGLVKYLILFLILLVAFWKGWQFLLKQLRHA